MTIVDQAVFLAAGIVGAWPSVEKHWNHNIAWGIIALWALLKLLHVLA